MERPQVRPMTVGDHAAVGWVRVRSWRAGYAGLVPAGVLRAMTVTPEWLRGMRGLAEQPGAVSLVAERTGRVAGFVVGGPERSQPSVPAVPGRAEVLALYVDPAHWGVGLGRALLCGAVAGLRAAGPRAVALWVLEGNDAGRRFYARCGLAADGASARYETGGATLTELRYLLPADRDVAG